MTEKLTIRTDTRLTPTMKKIIDREARKRRIALSAIIRLAIENFLERRS